MSVRARKASRSVKHSTPGIVLRVRLQPASGKPNGASAASAAWPRVPRPRTPTRRFAGGPVGGGLPAAGALVVEIEREVAVQGEDAEGHVFPHLLGETWLQHADHANPGRQGREVELVDAGPDREDQPQVRVGLGQALGRGPGHEVAHRARVFRAALPEGDLGQLLGEGAGEDRAPLRRREVEDGHQASAVRTSGSASVWSSVRRVRSTIASISSAVQQSGGA